MLWIFLFLPFYMLSVQNKAIGLHPKQAAGGENNAYLLLIRERHAAVSRYHASLIWSGEGWADTSHHQICLPTFGPESQQGQAPRPSQRRLQRTVLLKSAGGADVQPTQRFWVAMLYLELYFFLFFFINCLRSSMGRTGDAMLVHRRQRQAPALGQWVAQIICLICCPSVSSCGSKRW